jgi:hypothetical protein
LPNFVAERVNLSVGQGQFFDEKCPAGLEPIQEVRIHRQGFDLVKRRSMMRIMARRMKAAVVRA